METMRSNLPHSLVKSATLMKTISVMLRLLFTHEETLFSTLVINFLLIFKNFIKSIFQSNSYFDKSLLFLHEKTAIKTQPLTRSLR